MGNVTKPEPKKPPIWMQTESTGNTFLDLVLLLVLLAVGFAALALCIIVAHPGF